MTTKKWRALTPRDVKLNETDRIFLTPDSGHVTLLLTHFTVKPDGKKLDYMSSPLANTIHKYLSFIDKMTTTT